MNFKVLDENGNYVNCEIIYTFNNSDINYILYTDGTKDNDGKLEVYASRYELIDDNYVLKDIEDESEWDLVDRVLTEVVNK